MRPVLEQQAVDLVADVFGHAARVGRDHRHPRLLRLVEDLHGTIARYGTAA